MSPTALSLRLLRSWGFLADVCERWVPHKEIRRDLFGLADLIGVDACTPCVWLIQATSAANLSARVRKLNGLAATGRLIQAGIRIECWGWWQKSAGKDWRVKRVRIQANGLAPVEVTPSRRRGRQPKQRGLFGDD